MLFKDICNNLHLSILLQDDNSNFYTENLYLAVVGACLYLQMGCFTCITFCMQVYANLLSVYH